MLRLFFLPSPLTPCPILPLQPLPTRFPPSFPLRFPPSFLLRFPPNIHRKPSCSLSSTTTTTASPTPLPDDSNSDSHQEIARLILLLPEELRRNLESHPNLPDLIEIVMDLGRRPISRFPTGDFPISDRPISSQDIVHATSQVGDFVADNRAGISRTLHRISAIRNRKGAIIGLTCRVGRAVPGSANMLRDLVKDGGSLLLIGPPGVGKTTIIRDIARILADDYKKRVMIVDTSNEIGGDGDIPHPGIGSARRLQVPNPDMQHKVLIEAVENHMPQVIVIDEIGTKLEAIAASTIAQRGIQLVATAHGVTIENLIMNPSLEMLVGGIQSVTLGDEDASRRGVQKTVLERKGPSTFTSAAEIISKNEMQIHHDLEATVDALLAGRSPRFEVRKIDPKGSTYEIIAVQNDSMNVINGHEEDAILSEDHHARSNGNTTDDTLDFEFEEKLETDSHVLRVGFCLFIYGITETSVLQAIKNLGMDEIIQLTDNISEADAFLALHSKLKKNPQIQAVAKSRDMPVFVTKTNSLIQVTKAIRALINERAKGFNEVEEEEKVFSLEEKDALEETRLAIEQVVIPKGEHVELLPRPPHIISLQIDMIERYKLRWETVGKELDVHLLVLPLHPGIEEKGLSDRVAESGNGFEDLSNSCGINGSQNGVARLPLLPE